MKNILGFLFIILFTLIMARPGQAATPFKPNKSEFILGRAGETSSSLSFYFDDVLGPQINVTSGGQTFDLTAPLNVTGNVSGVDANFTGDASFASGTFSGVLSIGGNDTTFGDGAATDKKHIFDIGAGAANPYLGYNAATGKTVFNNGLAEKPLGSGSGSGGSGGVNLLTNDSYEDIGSGSPILDWTNSGGTLTQETFANGTETDEKFARFVASGAGQYLESDLVTIPEDFTFGMMADVRYTSGSSAFDLVILDSTETITYSSSSFGDLLEWDKKPTDTFKKPAAGTQIKFRVISTGAGTIDLNSAYLGSNKGFISGDKINSGSLRVQNNGTASIISQQNDFVSSVSRTGLGIVLVTFKSGVFSVPPAVKVSLESGNIAATFINPVNITTSSVEIRSADNGATFEDKDFSIIITKQGADSVSSQEAFTPEQANFFISGTIQSTTSNTTGAPSASPVAFISSTLQMTPEKGSSKIPCDSTNPSTGLNCSIGNETIGVVFNATTVGAYRVCFQFKSFLNSGVSGIRINRTENSSQTILKTGISYNGHPSADGQSNNICEFFDINSIGEVTTRLMYTTDGTISIYDSIGVANTYNQNIAYSVELVQNNVARPEVQNMVDTSIGGGMRVEACRIINNGTATIDTLFGSCDWLDSVTRFSLGVIHYNIKVGTFSKAPSCIFSTFRNEAYTNNSGFSATPTLAHSQTLNFNGNSFDEDQTVVCAGER